MATKSKSQLAKSELVAELPLACSCEAEAVKFLEAKRWANGAACPCCGSIDVYQMKDRKTGERSARFLWRCRDCTKMFTVRTGTVYAESLIPLHKWLRAMWEAASAKNCVSALEMSRKLELSYKSTLFLMHRIRHAMAHDPSPDAPLSGTVEVDETYVGPRKPRFPLGDKPRASTARGTKKQPVLALVERKGNVRTRVIADVTGATLRSVINAHVDPSSTIMTDEWKGYIGCGRNFAGGHKTVKHRRKEYVKPDGTSTNTVESFFARVKRGLNGTFHAVSRVHLHRYMDGFAFLYNTREMNDGERTLALIKRTEGKRLMYKTPREGAEMTFKAAV